MAERPGARPNGTAPRRGASRGRLSGTHGSRNSAAAGSTTTSAAPTATPTAHAVRERLHRTATHNSAAGERRPVPAAATAKAPRLTRSNSHARGARPQHSARAAGERAAPRPARPRPAAPRPAPAAVQRREAQRRSHTLPSTAAGAAEAGALGAAARRASAADSRPNGHPPRPARASRGCEGIPRPNGFCRTDGERLSGSPAPASRRRSGSARPDSGAAGLSRRRSGSLRGWPEPAAVLPLAPPVRRPVPEQQRQALSQRYSAAPVRPARPPPVPAALGSRVRVKCYIPPRGTGRGALPGAKGTVRELREESIAVVRLDSGDSLELAQDQYVVVEDRQTSRAPSARRRPSGPPAGHPDGGAAAPQGGGDALALPGAAGHPSGQQLQPGRGSPRGLKGRSARTAHARGHQRPVGPGGTQPPARPAPAPGRQSAGQRAGQHSPTASSGAREAEPITPPAAAPAAHSFQRSKTHSHPPAGLRQSRRADRGRAGPPAAQQGRRGEAGKPSPRAVRPRVSASAAEQPAGPPAHPPRQQQQQQQGSDQPQALRPQPLPPPADPGGRRGGAPEEDRRKSLASVAARRTLPGSSEPGSETGGHEAASSTHTPPQAAEQPRRRDSAPPERRTQRTLWAAAAEPGVTHPAAPAAAAAAAPPSSARRDSRRASDYDDRVSRDVHRELDRVVRQEVPAVTGGAEPRPPQQDAMLSARGGPESARTAGDSARMATARSTVSTFFYCDGCSTADSPQYCQGVRYNCLDSADYDLCEHCFRYNCDAELLNPARFRRIPIRPEEEAARGVIGEKVSHARARVCESRLQNDSKAEAHWTGVLRELCLYHPDEVPPGVDAGEGLSAAERHAGKRSYRSASGQGPALYGNPLDGAPGPPRGGDLWAAAGPQAHRGHAGPPR
eukprot:TRINITY_DN39004_c0_g2_i2.p1 TRINITY_DN39004_c0_g2~~TRINITY_DN39004_c0_g2_i2.p1  ORF type:complete len:931 (+),score=137.69 TRINITY_DN39004_c0_g2_i2:90-2795(+)